MTISAEALPDQLPADLVEQARRRRHLSIAVLLGAALVGALVSRHVPTWLDLHFQKFAQDRYKWTLIHRQSSPLFTRFFNPISDFLTWSVNHVDSLLNALRWPGVVALGGDR